jgi:NADPH:quinone reductase
MRAIRFKTFEDPSVLAEVVTPAVDERTALVRIMATSINPSDIETVASAMKQTTLPRIPGRDTASSSIRPIWSRSSTRELRNLWPA